LKTVSGRRENGLFMMEGIRAIRQALAAYPEGLDELIVSETFAAETDGFSAHRQRIVTESQFSSIVNSVNPQGIAAVLRIPEGSYSAMLPQDPGRNIVLLDNVQDPGNVGTVIRTAAAFHFSGVLLSHHSADPFSPKAVQASAGALFSPWIRRNDDIESNVRQLQRRGFRLACADVNGMPDIDFGQFDKVIVALGNEGSGLCAALLDLADVCFAIPMAGRAVESLNVAVSAAVSLFAVYRKCGWNT
jgi:TrmH family RNA methyltransferase